MSIKYYPDDSAQHFSISDSLFVKSDGVYLKILIHNIVYLRSEGNYIHIQGKGFKYLVRCTQKHLLSLLPEDVFMRIHRSYVVNLASISSIHPSTVFVDQSEIPVQRELRKELLSKLATV